jgi:hypothetical protein
VIINGVNKDGSRVYDFRIEGVVDLPRPMTALDAADFALRVMVHQNPVVHEIEAAVWGRADIGSQLRRECSAVAKYDGKQGVHMRYTPWLGDGEYREIGDPEGAVILPVNHEIK